MRSRAQVGGLLFAACLLLSSTRAVADAAESAAQAPSLTVVTLGTGGGPAYRDKRAMPSSAVLFGKDVHIVDAGEGLLHRLAAAGLQVDQVQSVFITHHHFDHNADLGPLIGFRWLARQYAPLPVIGPPMTKQMV
ncbi:MAG: MBL fold metallo-hydrolase, partial [Gammaproteobacteria bacterium]